MHKVYDLVDYESWTPIKEIVPETSRIITRSKIRGTTIVNHIIDKNFERLLIGGRYGQGID